MIFWVCIQLFEGDRRNIVIPKIILKLQDNQICGKAKTNSLKKSFCDLKKKGRHVHRLTVYTSMFPFYYKWYTDNQPTLISLIYFSPFAFNLWNYLRPIYVINIISKIRSILSRQGNHLPIFPIILLSNYQLLCMVLYVK